MFKAKVLFPLSLLLFSSLLLTGCSSKVVETKPKAVKTVQPEVAPTLIPTTQAEADKLNAQAQAALATAKENASVKPPKDPSSVGFTKSGAATHSGSVDNDVDKAPVKVKGSYPTGFNLPSGGNVFVNILNGEKSIIGVNYPLALDEVVTKLKADLETEGFTCSQCAAPPAGGAINYLMVMKKENLWLSIAPRIKSTTETQATFNFNPVQN